MNRRIGQMVKAALSGAALTVAAASPAAYAAEEPFKQTNIHFETNASACDMGIQMSFDTDGLTEGEVEGPFEQVVFSFRAVDGMEVTDDLTEMFHERVEPPISDLLDALDCEEPEGDPISLAELFGAWPAGWYEFDGESGGVEFEGRARLTQKIPAGPEILAPEDGAVVPHDASTVIRWKKVTAPLLPELGPVEITGYHVVVADVTDPVLAPERRRRHSTPISRNPRRPFPCRNNSSSPTESTSSRCWRRRGTATRRLRKAGCSAPADCAPGLRSAVVSGAGESRESFP